MIEVFSEEYKILNQKKEKLKDLLFYSGINIENLEIIEDRDNRLTLVLNCICKSKTGYDTKFHKEFKNDYNLDAFIDNVEMASKMNTIGGPKITMYPIIAGGIQDFWYYIDEKKIDQYELSYLFKKNLENYKKEITEKINKLNFIFMHLRNLDQKYQDLIGNYSRTKNNIISNLNKNSVFNKEILIDKSLTIGSSDYYEIDVEKLINLIKNYTYGKEIPAQIIKIFDELEKAIIDDNKRANFSSHLVYENRLIDDYIIINKLIDMLFIKIEYIEKSLLANIELLQNQFSTIKNLVDTLNNTNGKERKKIYEDANIPNIERKKLEDKIDIENYHNYNHNDIQNDIIGANLESQIFKSLEQKQNELLNEDEIIALNLYKLQLYRAYNPIIKYINNNNIDDSEYYKNEIIENIIKKAYNEMYESYKSIKDSPFYHMSKIRRNNESMTIGEKIFTKFDDEMPTYEQYRNLVLTYINPLISALNKVTLDEDLIVYRGDNNPYDEFSGIISTSISKKVANEFIEGRDREHKQTGALYRIVIPKGSPVICFSNSLLYGKNKEVGFDDSQKEIIFDSGLFDYTIKYRDIDFNENNNYKKTANYIDVNLLLKEKNKLIH